MRYFLLGMLFIYLGIPILDGIAAQIENFSQLLTCRIAKKIYDIKQQMKDIEDQQQKNPIGFQTDCIGYQIPSPSDYEQEEQDE